MTDRWIPTTDRDQLVRDALVAVRSFSDSMDRMHGVLRSDMDMNGSDLAALRMLIVREQRGEWVSPHEIARHLAISTASTTKLLDRLAERGHIERRPRPADRRARIVMLTDRARSDFFRHLGARMAKMRDVMNAYSDDELRVVARFLDDMDDAMVD
ncbi:DNA-binding MarR family transcriptional regulator [Microbacterium laevaniformans]|uniref:MarR family winged helix-turn-helix transcriptional regulator n=1 Tax=Microbacterium laevaniformans TaxID=36807 RepID=UPI00195D404F|nr:MarR family transcriptional regulator [Microbacterium laevaniformans]MBM7752810.1 DNA-binding MarR family transcriptional regulator [Microbacterium laevaniformans]